VTTALPGVAVAAPGGGVTVRTGGRVDVADRVFRKAAEQAVPRLDDSEAVRAATPVLEAARGIQNDLHDRLTRLFGREVSRVDLTIAGATAPKRRRVK